MHEVAVTQSILKIAEEEGLRAGASRVTEIRLVMGQCTCLVPEIVQDYFALFAEGTIAEAAKLAVRRIPGRILCHSCGETSEIRGFRMVCPCCGKRDTELLQGREFYIDSIEVESEEDEQGNQDRQAGNGME